MLILSRKEFEKLILRNRETGEFIAEVSVARIAGNRVNIGIEAPDHVRVVRGELKPEKKEGPDE